MHFKKYQTASDLSLFSFSGGRKEARFIFGKKYTKINNIF